MLARKVKEIFILFVLLSPLSVKAQEGNNIAPKTREEILTINDKDFFLGDRNAKVKIFEYSSLSCPHCSTFHKMTFPHIKENYIDKGKVVYVFRDFPANHPATLASMLINCSGDRKLDFMETLFNTQKVWAFNMAYKDKLHNIAKLGGMSDEDYQACMNNKEKKNTMLEGAYQAARALNIDATPVFFINGNKVEGMVPYGKIAEIIETELKNSAK